MVHAILYIQRTSIWLRKGIIKGQLWMEKDNRSSMLALEISGTEEPGRLPSTGSQRVGHNRVMNTFTFFMVRSFHLLEHSIWSCYNQ